MRTGKLKQLFIRYVAGSDRSYRELWPTGKFTRLLWLASLRFTADRNSLRAVALTYYTLFAIVPMLALAFGIAKGFALQEKLQEILSEKLANQREILEGIYPFADSTLQQTQSGVIAGAGLDVFWNEPTHVDDEILSCPNVIVSPHSAAQTREAVIKMATMCVNGCLAVCEGKKWPYVADKAVYDHPKWAGKEWAEV